MQWENFPWDEKPQGVRDGIDEVLVALHDYGAYSEVMHHAYPFVALEGSAEEAFWEAEWRIRDEPWARESDARDLERLTKKYLRYSEYAGADEDVGADELQKDRARLAEVLKRRTALVLEKARAALAEVDEDALVRALPEWIHEWRLGRRRFLLFGAAMLGLEVLENGILDSIGTKRRTPGLYAHLKMFHRDGKSGAARVRAGLREKVDAVPAIKMLVADMWHGKRAEKLPWLQKRLGMISDENVAFFLGKDFVAALECLATELRPVLDRFPWRQQHLAPLIHACCLGVLQSVPTEILAKEMDRLVPRSHTQGPFVPVADLLLQKIRNGDGNVYYFKALMGPECMWVINAIRKKKRIRHGSVNSLGRGSVAYRRAILYWAIFQDFGPETRDFLVGEALWNCKDADADMLFDSDFCCRFQCLGAERQAQAAQVLQARLREGGLEATLSAMPFLAGQKRRAEEAPESQPKKKRPFTELHRQHPAQDRKKRCSTSINQ